MVSPANQEIPINREHHFYVSIAKSVFNHSKHGIVFVRDPISLKDGAKFGLKPLILYGITVAGTPINWLTFSSIDEPRPFCSVLQEAWRTASGLRGYPDILKINRQVLNASPKLAGRLAQIGIQVVTAEPNDKLFPTSLRSAHNTALDAAWRAHGNDAPINNLKMLCTAAQASHNFDQRIKSWDLGTTKKSVAERANQWIALPVNHIESDLPAEPDWTPGPWLSAWEVNLPPCSPRYFHDSNGIKWLLSGQTGEAYDGEDEYDYAVESVKLMVGSWPNKPVEIAKSVGITLRQLQWFLTERVELPWAELNRLLSLLGVVANDELGEYEPTGPCVLIAKAPRAISHSYERLSHGGDLEFSVEVVPEKVPADPSWRYLVFKSFGGSPNIIMIPRGTPIAEQVNDDLFINFDGQKEVPATFYRDVVATCARACIDPAANLPEMKGFAERYYRGDLTCLMR